ncbi:MAG: leucine-rich repeat protein [Gemmatimonadetes bacterium]|nr:leucine-rich repeat protein [Gemmatimonadota bacterium]
MRVAILRSGILLALTALGTSAATAQTELFFATGVDSTGRALAQSNADGHVLIESPQYPRGLWLHLVNEAGDALAGIRVEYQGRPDSLVAIHCVDPAGGVQETLIWTRPEGDPLRLTLKPKEASDLPVGLIPIDWQIDPSLEALLVPVAETWLIGWEAVAAFLRKRWQDERGRVAVQLDASTNLAIELHHPEAIEILLDHLQQTHQLTAASLAEETGLRLQIYKGPLSLLEGLVLSTPLFRDSNLEAAVRQIVGRPQGRLTPKDVASLTVLFATHSTIHSLVGLEHFAALQRLELDNNRIADLTPLASLTNLQTLVLRNNQIANVSPLAQSTTLQVLMLTSNQRIADVSPLASLTNLRWLCLTENQVADVSPLASLTNLERLWLTLNQITDVSPLASLTNLKTLVLGQNQVADISPLASLINLRELYMDYNQIVDLTPLASLTNLEILWLQGNPLSDQALNEQIPALQARGVRVRY